MTKQAEVVDDVTRAMAELQSRFHQSETQDKTWRDQIYERLHQSRSKASDKQSQKDRESTSRLETVEGEVRAIHNQCQSALRSIAQQSEDLLRTSDEHPIKKELSTLRHVIGLMLCIPDAGLQRLLWCCTRACVHCVQLLWALVWRILTG